MVGVVVVVAAAEAIAAFIVAFAFAAAVAAATVIVDTDAVDVGGGFLEEIFWLSQLPCPSGCERSAAASFDKPETPCLAMIPWKGR